MDHFMEEVVVQRNKTFQEIAYVMSFVLMIVCALLGVMMLNGLIAYFSIGALIETVVMLGLAVLLYLRKDHWRTEYEYTFTNGDLDFAKVYNNQKRKTLGTMRVKNVESFGPVDSDHFRRLINTPGLTRRNWFLNRSAKLYYFYYQKDNSKNMIVLEPSEELVDMIRKYLPRGVYQE